MMKIAFKESTRSTSVVKLGIRLGICIYNSQMSRFQQPITRQFFIFKDPGKAMLKLLFFRYPNWAFSSKNQIPTQDYPKPPQISLVLKLVRH
jgi:hypothetical protein